MPKSSPIQTNFSGGELGPNVEGRVDSEKYATGLEICQNYIPLLEGPLIRRSGTKRVASVKDPSKPPRFIPFKISNTDQYLIEVGENYFRFFTDQGQAITSGTSYVVTGATFLGNQYGFQFGSPFNHFCEAPFYASRTTNKPKKMEIDNATAGYTVVFSTVVSGTILQVPTPYGYGLINNIGYTQKGDTLWLMHSSMPTFTLQRFGAQDWDLKYFATSDGPYLPLNSYKTIGDSLNKQFLVSWNPNRLPATSGAAAGYNITITTHSTVKVANCVNSGGKIQVNTQSHHGFEERDRVWIRGIFGTTEANNGSSLIGQFSTEPSINESSIWTVSINSATSIILLDSVFTNAYIGSGLIYPAFFNPQDAGRSIGLYTGGERYFGFIRMNSSIVDPVVVGTHPIQVQVALAAESAFFPVSSTIVSIWQMGSYSRHTGYPSAGAFHQDRLVFGGTPGVPAQFNASNTGSYSKFNVNEASSLIVLDTNGLQFSLVSESQDLLQWVKSGTQGLYFGSDSTEFLVSPSKDGQSLTPTNVNSDIIGNYGAANINPVRFGDSIIYIQSSKSKIRELRYFANIQSHKSTQINQLSDHIAYPKMSGLAVQKETTPLLWGYRTDGKLISMSYARDDSQAVSGWAPHELGGSADSGYSPPRVKSIETMRNSSGAYDQVWMIVERFINGTSTVEVEYMTDTYRHRDINQKQRDAYYLDCGATYDSSLVITNITRGSALVTIANHGLVRNDLVLISDVVGVSSSLININGVVVGSTLLNDKVFVVGSTSANNFFLQDFNSSIILTQTYSPYFSGGVARKLVSSVGGLTWLKNEEVDILGDGGIQGKATVNSAGVITLTNPAAVVQIGYAYKSRGKTLIKENGSATGSAIGQLRKTYQTAFKLKDVGDFSYGGIDFNNLHQANFGLADEQMADAATRLFSGIYRDGIEQDVSFYGQVFFEQNSPLPGMIQSITYLMDETDL